MNRIPAIIIDDEFFNRKLIILLIEKLNPVFKIEGEAENIKEGYKIINEIKPQVVFLDIKMPDGSGFDLLKQFDAVDFEVVFITGFDQYTLLAFDFNALDYVLKPIDSDKFKITLDKVQSRIENKRFQFSDIKAIIEMYNAENTILIRIPIHYNNKVTLLDPDDIMYLRTIEKRTQITTSENQEHHSTKELKYFEFILNNYPNYIRANKDTFINVNYISSYSKGFDHLITMKSGTTIETSTKKKEEIIKLLEK